MSHTKLHFYDAANAGNVPSGVVAFVPVDGDFAWRESDVHRMSRVARYTVLGGAEAARHARGIDIEVGDRANNPDEYMPFLIARHKSHGDATPYCNRSTLPSVQQHCERAGILSGMHFWVATLDGTQDVPGAWAVQYEGGFTARFDLSVLHGVDNFHRP